MTAWHGIGKTVVNSTEALESALLVLALVLVANIYNLVALYHQRLVGHQGKRYGLLVLAYACILIVSIVLLWGQPANLALPYHLDFWTGIFILLNGFQAKLGLSLAHYLGPSQPTQLPYLSLGMMSSVLLILGYLLPLFLLQNGRYRVLVLVAGLVGIAGLVVYQWCVFPRVLAAGLGRQGASYQVLAGASLASSFLALFFGFDTAVLRENGGRLDLISYCFVVCLLVTSISNGLLAVLQRYPLKHEFSLDRDHRQRYLYGGTILLVLFLVLTCYLIVKT